MRILLSVPLASLALALLPQSVFAADPAGCHGGFIQFTQQSAAPGAIVSGTGSCWLPGGQVRLSWRSSGAAQTVLAAADGSFTFSTTVPTATGDQLLAGTEVAGKQSMSYYNAWIQVAVPPAPSQQRSPQSVPQAARRSLTAAAPRTISASIQPLQAPVAPVPVMAHTTARSHVASRQPVSIAVSQPAGNPVPAPRPHAAAAAIPALAAGSSAFPWALAAIALLSILGTLTFVAVRRLPKLTAPLGLENA